MNNNCYENYECAEKPCNYNCSPEDLSECDEYKEKSDTLYIKAHAIQDEVKRLMCEAETYSEEAKSLERKSRELCAKANMTWDKAKKLEADAINLLDLASFYCCKASECYKNISSNLCRPDCNVAHAYKCRCQSKCK